MKMPFVSIVTCVYERQEFLPFLIQQIIAQDYPHTYMEWLIMDDSKEPTDLFTHLPRLEQGSSDLDGISVSYCFLNHKITLGEKRTALNKKCRGDYILVCDDDDYYPPTRVSYAVDMLFYHPTYSIAGVDSVFIYFTDDQTIYLSPPTFANHALCNTFAYTKKYATEHTFGTVDYAEEAIFTEQWQEPLLQLDPFQTVLMIAHERNTIDKHPFRPFLLKTQLKLSDFIKIDIINTFCNRFRVNGF
jgi:glycosyltransferase involved in cell wall biosynthesis